MRPPEGLQTIYGTEALWISGWTGRKRLNELALRRYGYACQSPEEGLFARSVREELDYSLKPYKVAEEKREELRDSAIRAVGWEPSGWLTRDPYQMSGGERRRSALASVFVTPSPWLLLDEPTAGLDGAGHETVARELANLRESGKGIVLVSHDSDWAMALADGVLLLSRDGSLRFCSRNELLEHPEWLEDTGMSIPEWLRVANLLCRSGVSSDKIWNPAAVAKAWPTAPIRSEGMLEKVEEEASRQSETVVRAEKKKSHRLKGFDPRSVWLSYVLISTGLLALADWVALGVGGLIVCLLLYAGRVSLKRWHSMILSFVIFSVLTSAIFAWGASGEGGAFEGGAFLATLLTFTRTLFILLLGLAIPLVMSPLSLRRALEQLLTFRGKLPKRAQQLTLIVALMMRFVPVLLELWERFVRIFLSRGKSISRNPIAIGRRLRDVSIPFLLALFRLGDEVTLALESRGVGLDARPTQGTRLRWKKRDYGFVLGALVLAVGLWGFTNR